jgi:hypothetical protein
MGKRVYLMGIKWVEGYGASGAPTTGSRSLLSGDHKNL